MEKFPPCLKKPYIVLKIDLPYHLYSKPGTAAGKMDRRAEGGEDARAEGGPKATIPDGSPPPPKEPGDRGGPALPGVVSLNLSSVSSIHPSFPSPSPGPLPFTFPLPPSLRLRFLLSNGVYPSAHSQSVVVTPHSRFVQYSSEHW